MSLPLGRCGPEPGHVAWLVEYGPDTPLRSLPQPPACHPCAARSLLHCHRSSPGRWPLSRPYSDLPHPLPLPCPVALAAPGKGGQRLPPPGQAAASIPCPSPAHPGWAACRLQAAPGSESPALCPGCSLSAPTVWPLVWAGEQCLPSVRVSGSRFASALCGWWPVLLHLSAGLGLADAELLWRPQERPGRGLGPGKFPGERPAFFFTLINLFIWSFCGGGVFSSLRPLKCCPGVQDAWPERAAFPTPAGKSTVSSAYWESERLKKGPNREASWQVVSILHQGKLRLRDALGRGAHPEPRVPLPGLQQALTVGVDTSGGPGPRKGPGKAEGGEPVFRPLPRGKMRRQGLGPSTSGWLLLVLG